MPGDVVQSSRGRPKSWGGRGHLGKLKTYLDKISCVHYFDVTRGNGAGWEGHFVSTSFGWIFGTGIQGRVDAIKEMVT
jgi:hypothetical protein